MISGTGIPGGSRFRTFLSGGSPFFHGRGFSGFFSGSPLYRSSGSPGLGGSGLSLFLFGGSSAFLAGRSSALVFFIVFQFYLTSFPFSKYIPEASVHSRIFQIRLYRSTVQRRPLPFSPEGLFPLFASVFFLPAVLSVSGRSFTDFSTGAWSVGSAGSALSDASPSGTAGGASFSLRFFLLRGRRIP